VEFFLSHAETQKFLTSVVLGFSRAFPVLLVSGQLKALMNTRVAVALALVFSLITTGFIENRINISATINIPLLVVGNSIVGCVFGVLLSGCLALVAQIGRAMDNLTGARSVLNIEGEESGVAGVESFFMLVGIFLVLKLELYALPLGLYVELFNYVSPTLDISFSMAQLEQSSELAARVSLQLLEVVLYILMPLLLSLLVFDLLGAFAARVMPEIPIAFELAGYRSLCGALLSIVTVVLELPERIRVIFEGLYV